MGSVLDRILAKVGRAEQHLQDLQLAVSAFADSKPYGISIREDHQARQRVYYVSKVNCIPIQLTLIAADVIQNLRSPLDQIAYQLVLAARGGAEPERRVYFPITSK